MFNSYLKLYNIKYDTKLGICNFCSSKNLSEIISFNKNIKEVNVKCNNCHFVYIGDKTTIETTS